MKRVKEAYENGVDTLEEYRENKQNIQREIDSIIAEIQKEQCKDIDPEIAIRKLKEKIKKSLATLKDESVSAKEKNAIAREFIIDIIKTGDDGRKFNIMYRL